MTLLTTTTNQPARMTRANTDNMLIDGWLSLKNSRATQETYRIAIDQFMDWYACHLVERRPDCTDLQCMTVEDLSDYKDFLTASGASLSTQALKLKTVKSLLSYGHKVGYLLFDIGRAVKAAQPSSDLAERILEEWQVQQLIRHPALSNRDRMLIRLLYASGGRVSEIVNLQWRHVKANGETGQITVTGKGSKTRAIKLGKEVWGALVVFKPFDAGDSDFIFLSQRRCGQEDRNGQLDRTAVNRIVQNAGKLIGVDNVSPHWFRHSHASHALDKKAPISLVQQTLGHSSLAVTSRYTHAKPGESSATYLDA